MLKLLDVRIIYPIADSKWVSPTQVVPKKSSLTIVKNEHDELIPTRVIRVEEYALIIENSTPTYRSNHRKSDWSCIVLFPRWLFKIQPN